MVTDRSFDTNVFFSGGAGMFLQYHDIVKPVYLYAVMKMIITQETFGLPIQVIADMSVPSIIEWYIKRRFINPFQCLDYDHVIKKEDIDYFLKTYLEKDDSIYKLAPAMNVKRMLSVYTRQHMTFPVYVYTENEEPFVKEDCKSVFPGINVRYLYGSLEECLKKCGSNFTYIFSDIELAKSASDTLKGICSHILLAREYRYNYLDHNKTFKHDLNVLAGSHPNIRMGTTVAIDPIQMANSLSKFKIKREAK